MAINVEALKKLQNKKGGNAIRGKFWLIANPNTQEEKTLGYTTEGTFSVDRTYRDADQNQTVSNVKGLKFLDEAQVMFETQSLQLDPELMTQFKGFKAEQFIDEIDGRKYTKLQEDAFVDFVRYIDTLAIVAELTDGRNIVIEMYNVLETSSESLSFNRTDDTTVSLQFEAHITDDDNDEVLPYAIFIEGETNDEIVRKASAELSKKQFIVKAGSTIEEQIISQAEAHLGQTEEYADVLVSISADEIAKFEGAKKGDFIKGVELGLVLEDASGNSLIAASVIEDINGGEGDILIASITSHIDMGDGIANGMITFEVVINDVETPSTYSYKVLDEMEAEVEAKDFEENPVAVKVFDGTYKIQLFEGTKLLAEESDIVVPKETMKSSKPKQTKE